MGTNALDLLAWHKPPTSQARGLHCRTRLRRELACPHCARRRSTRRRSTSSSRKNRRLAESRSSGSLPTWASRMTPAVVRPSRRPASRGDRSFTGYLLRNSRESPKTYRLWPLGIVCLQFLKFRVTQSYKYDIVQVMIGEPTFAQGQRRVILSESERRVLGISKRIIEVKEDWIEADLDPRWVAAFRVIRDDRGLPVFGEVRVFPQGKRPTTWRGRWSAEVTGSSAQAPRGGITARLLRRIQTGPSEALLAKASRLFARDAQREKGPLPPYLKDGAAPLLIAAGERVRRHPPTPGRGRRPEPDATYAKVADAYVTAFREHRRAPILDTAKRFQMSPRQGANDDPHGAPARTPERSPPW